LLISLFTLFNIISLYSFSGRVTYDKDINGYFDIEKQFCFIDHENGKQIITIIINAPEQFEGEQPIWIFPIPASSEKVEVSIKKEKKAYIYGYIIDILAECLLFNLFSFVYNSQLYPIYVVRKVSRYYPQYLVDWAGHMDNEHEKELELEKTFDVITQEERIKTIGFSTDVLLREKGRSIEGVDVCGQYENMGLTAELLTVEDNESFLKYLYLDDINSNKSLVLILKDYVNKDFSFLMYGITDIEKYKNEQPVQYIVNLLTQNKYRDAYQFVKRIKDLNTTVNSELVKNCYDCFVYPDFDRVRLKELAKSHWFQDGEKLVICIEFPSENIFIPLRIQSIYGDKIIPFVIYISNYVKPKIYQEISLDSRITYLHHFLLSMKQTKIEIYPKSRSLREDLVIYNSPPVKTEIAHFVNNSPPFRNRIHLWVWTRFIFLAIFIFFPVSICASYLSSLLVFRKTHVKRWKFAFIGFFNFFTLVGFIIAVLILKTKQFINKKGVEIYTGKDIRKIWYIMIFSITFLLITTMIHLIIRALIM